LDDVILTTCYPDTEAKLGMLRDLISRIRSTTSIPIALSTHYLIPSDIIDSLDYLIYDKNDAPSSDFTLYYHFSVPNDLHIRTRRQLPYHALSGYTSLKNAFSLFRDMFTRLHYIQYDTVMRIPEYISMATSKLKLQCYNFVGAEYRVPAQNLSGIVATFFSVDTKWFDSHLPQISTWEEWKSYGRDGGDSLMGENWLHNYFTDHGMIPYFYFMDTPEFSKYIISEKIQTREGSEPGLQVYLSELSTHQLILFVHLYTATGSLSFTINRNGITKPITLNAGTVYWELLDKSGYVKVESREQSKEFLIDPTKEYTDTQFKFQDGKFKCLKEI
jgi:hypothetical protein